MQTNESAAPMRPVTEEQTPCGICDKPVDLRQLCAIWPKGVVAHVDCYETHWLSVGIAEGIAVAGEIGS